MKSSSRASQTLHVRSGRCSGFAYQCCLDVPVFFPLFPVSAVPHGEETLTHAMFLRITLTWWVGLWLDRDMLFLLRRNKKSPRNFFSSCLFFTMLLLESPEHVNGRNASSENPLWSSSKCIRFRMFASSFWSYTKQSKGKSVITHPYVNLTQILQYVIQFDIQFEFICNKSSGRFIGLLYVNCQEGLM